MTWGNALARLIVCPLIVAVGDYLFEGIYFAAHSQWIAVGLTMATISIAMDAIFLDFLGPIWSSALITAVVAGILRLTPSLMPEAETTRAASIGELFYSEW